MISARARQARTDARRRRGGAARERGRSAEWVAAAWLMLHGWRITGFRHRTREGEIDLLARRGRVLAVVEVKRRATLDEAAASVGPTQLARLSAVVERLAVQPANADLTVRLDIVALAPGRLPRHIANAMSPSATGAPRRP